MAEWFAGPGFLLLITLAGGAYFGFYVAAARDRRKVGVARPPEKDC